MTIYFLIRRIFTLVKNLLPNSPLPQLYRNEIKTQSIYWHPSFLDLHKSNREETKGIGKL